MKLFYCTKCTVHTNHAIGLHALKTFSIIK